MILHNFFVLEGIDGSGTSTQLKILQEKLEKQGKKAFFSTEPTTGSTGLFLRRMLSGEIKLHPATAAFLFAADRNEHIYGKNGIKEHLENGDICVSDRYLFSSLAYQSQECGKELPAKINEDFPLPEILFYFSIDPAVSLKRIIGRGVTEIYEKEEFLRKTEAEYRRVINDFKGKSSMRIVEIDATKSIEEISTIIWNEISADK